MHQLCLLKRGYKRCTRHFVTQQFDWPLTPLPGGMLPRPNDQNSYYTVENRINQELRCYISCLACLACCCAAAAADDASRVQHHHGYHSFHDEHHHHHHQPVVVHHYDAAPVGGPVAYQPPTGRTLLFPRLDTLFTSYSYHLEQDQLAHKATITKLFF